MAKKKHYHLMNGAAYNPKPEHAEFFTTLESAKQGFETMKRKYIESFDQSAEKLFFSVDEMNDPEYSMICQFGTIGNLKEYPNHPSASGDAELAGVVEGNWSPIFMIMLVECDEETCLHSIN